MYAKIISYRLNFYLGDIYIYFQNKCYIKELTLCRFIWNSTSRYLILGTIIKNNQYFSQSSIVDRN